MAIIVGATDREEIRVLQKAGYDVATLETVISLLKSVAEAAPAMAVWVDCNISDLLSPPLCKFCGRLMVTYKDPDVVGTDTGVIHICECGAWVQVCTHPPKE